MRKALRTSILILALSGSAYAGIIPCDVPAPPAPATAGVTAEPIGEPANAQETEVTLIEIALGLLQSALSVF